MIGNRPELLLVDDRLENLAVLTQVITENLPLAMITTAGSAEEALAKVATRNFDGILTDVQMPGIDGLELCRRLKANADSVDIPVILITSNLSTAEFRVASLAAGALEFISRPIDNIELVARILSMLRIKWTEDQLRTTNFNLAQRVASQTVSLREYQKVVESTPDLVATISADYRYRMVNDTFARYYCLDSEQIVGQRVASLVPGNTFEDQVRPRLDACLQGETIEFEDSRNYLELGLRYLLIRYSPLKGEAGRIEGVVAIQRDITERKQLEGQLQQMQKMEALGTLAGGIAHDFNNVLAAIYGYTQVSQLHVGKDAKLGHNLQQIAVAANRATELVKQILTFSRNSTEELQPLEIHLIVKEVLKFLQVSIPNLVKVRQEIAPDVGMVLGNPTQIHRVMMNLCTNAYQALAERGGTIDVSLKSVAVDQSLAATHPDLQLGAYALLEVRDNGPGMDTQVAARIFDPFFTSKKVGEGTGMGLAVVHGIVKSCGGAILVDSYSGRGSTFAIYFPQHQKEIKVNGSLPEKLPHGTEHILFVDDENTLVELGHDLLGSLGYRITGCSDSRDALEKFRRNPAEYDLVVLDLAMPGLSGADLAREIIALRADMPVIIYTGYLGPRDGEQAQCIGVKALLVKPLGRARFACELRRVLDEASGAAIAADNLNCFGATRLSG